MTTAIKETKASPSEEQAKRLSVEKIYGIIHKRPVHLDAEIESEDRSFAAGLATLKRQTLTAELESKKVTIPFTSVIPKKNHPCPAIVSLNYENSVPNKYLPAEEIIEREYAIFALNCEEICPSNGDFKSGIYRQVAGSRRKKNAPGKLALWAWASTRIMEYARELEAIDADKIAISGHAVLAGSALLAAACDDRFTAVLANSLFPFESGRSTNGLAFLFSHGYESLPEADGISRLLDTCSSKTVAVGASTDECMTVDELANELEKKLFTDFDGRSQKISTESTLKLIKNGNIFLHIRDGGDYFSRRDWKTFLDILDGKVDF